MFFDEPKQKKLFEIYSALPEREKKIYRLLTVIGVPVDIEALFSTINALKHISPPRKYGNYTRSDLSSMLFRWVESGLVVSDTPSYYFRYGNTTKWHCPDFLSGPVIREALTVFGDYSEFNRLVEGTTLRVSALVQAMDNAPKNLRCARLVRKAVSTRDGALFAKLRRQGTKPEYSREDVEYGLVRALFCPLDEETLLDQPEEIGSAALAGAFDLWREAPSEVKKLLELLARYRGQYPDNALLRGIEFKNFLCAGRVEEAEKMLSESTPVDLSDESEAFCATAALMKGELDKALALYEEGLKRLRKLTGKRNYMYETWCGVFYPLLLIRAQAPEKKIREYIRLDRPPRPQLENAYLLMENLLGKGPERKKIFSKQMLDYAKSSTSRLNVLIFMLCASWIAPEDAVKHVKLAADACRQLTESGMNYAASELASILREIAPETAKKFQTLPEPAYPLKKLLEYKPDWVFSLETLKDLGGAPQALLEGKEAQIGEKRLTWNIDWNRALDGKVGGIILTPVEQTYQAKGWSRGKPVALRRIVREPESITSTTQQDGPVLKAANVSLYGDYFIKTGPALRALVGHPFLFDSTGAPLELLRREPKILVLSRDGGYKLVMDPCPDSAELKNAMIVFEDAPNRLAIVDFGEKHLKIASILGQDGLNVPAEAKDQILETLSSLASVVTVHADVEGVESGADYVEPDTALYVQLQPHGEGISIEAVTRPLGPESVACVPGMGASNLFGLVNERRVQTKRDLAGEAKAFDAFVYRCGDVLENADQDQAENCWLILDAEASLEFLLRLREMEDEVVIEWPKGGKRQVRRVGAFSASVSGREADHWFSVSGELKVDEDLVFSMKEILKHLGAAKGRFVRIGNDDFIALTDSYRRTLETLNAVGDFAGDEIRISALSAALLSDMEEAVDSFEGGKKWKRQTALIDEAARLLPALPQTFRGELREYQEEGYRWLARLAHWGAGACLADDMGLGKTVQALALLLARGEGGPALVVAPTSVCSNWIEEAERFSPTLNMKELRYGDRESMVKGLEAMDVLIASYSLLQNEQELLSGIHWHTIVLDEAQAIKNMATKRSASAMKLQGDFRVITTGTPIENNLGELWNLFRFINPHYLGSHESFNRKFALPIERDGDKATRKRLKKIIAPFLLRRTKAQVLTELPPKTDITLRVEMKEEERSFYEALRRNALEDLARYDKEDKRFKIFAQLVKLRRACCSSSLVTHGEGPRYPSAKLEAFSEVVDDLRAGGHKALIFSQFVDHLALLRKCLEEKGVSYQYLDGSTPPAERTKRVKAFQAGVGDCFLISLKAGGTGLNLTIADYVIHMDPWWNPAVEEQASDRTHRIGQQRPVTVYRIVAKDTIEEKIVDLHSWKRDLANSLLDEAELPVTLSAEEMLKLIADA